MMTGKKTTLLNAPSIYKPFHYPWAYEYWAKQQKMHWIAEEVNMCDDVKDWKSKLNDEERNFLTQIFRFFTQADIEVNGAYTKLYPQVFQPTEILMMFSAFSNIECFSADTEILTSNGWVKFPDLKNDDLVAQYNCDNEEISFVKPKKLVSYDYKGNLKHFKNTTTDILVTPNHDMLLKYAGERGEKKGFAKKKAEFCACISNNYVYPTAGKITNFVNHFGEKEKLLIAIQADGCLRGLCPKSSEKHFTTDMQLSKERKITRLKSILFNLGIKYSEIDTKRNNLKRYTFTIKSLNIDLKQVKNFAWINLNHITSDWANEFIDELKNWDCGLQGDAIYYYNTNKEAIDKVQAVAVLAGYGTNISINRKGGYDAIICGKTRHIEKDCFVLTISNQKNRALPKPVDVFYDDKIYCVSVDTENIVVRRNNKVAITGNTVHIDSYAKLIDTVGMPEVEYSAFLEYQEMREKYEYMHQFNVKDNFNIALTLAGYGAFTEGLQLFASFAMLLNFQRFNKMKGMCQIVAFSVKDETLHCEALIKLFHTFLEENPEVNNRALENNIIETCKEIVRLEDAFIDLAFNGCMMQGLTAEEVKNYIRFIANRRLIQLGYKPIYDIHKNPLPWLDEMLNGVEFGNFFEVRPTEYSKGATKGDWSDVFDDSPIEYETKGEILYCTPNEYGECESCQ